MRIYVLLISSENLLLIAPQNRVIRYIKQNIQKYKDISKFGKGVSSYSVVYQILNDENLF
jgi:hypothetical protein